MCFVSMYVCVPHVIGVQKGVLGALELELQMVVSHHVGAGKQTWVLWKNQCS